MHSITSERNFMLNIIVVILLYDSFISSECPDELAISPCACTNSNDQITFSCVGPVQLPRLTTVLRNAMCGKFIRKFELRESDVEYLPSNLFLKVMVEDIQISFTNLTHFTQAGRSAFFGLEPHLKSLSMRHCGLADKLQWPKLGELRSLSYLDLSYNNLTKVDRAWFYKPAPALRSLILKHNRISFIEIGAFEHLYLLVELDVSENQISVISRSIFPKFSNQLIFLRASDNQLTTIPDDFFEEMLGLRRLYLDGNKLESLPQNVWSPIWTDLEHLDLSGNPFTCDCNFAWISELSLPRLIYGHCRDKELKNLEVNDFQNCII